MMSSRKQRGGHNVSRQELENRIRRSILEITRENDTSIRDDVAIGQYGEPYHMYMLADVARHAERILTAKTISLTMYI